MVTGDLPGQRRNRDSTDMVDAFSDDSTIADVGRPLRILVAEDDAINQRIIAAILQHIDCGVDIVANGREAVEAAARTRYDVILMDIQMPVMDGLMATQAIRQFEGECGRVPIIAVTANTVMDTHKEYVAAGLDDYLPKPIDLDTISAVIARYVGRSSVAR